MNFRSDNEWPVAPAIMQALVLANTGTAWSYGEDEFSSIAQRRFARVFEHDLEFYPVTTGTAANSLAVAQTTPSYGAVLCHEDSHLHTDECGAPEFYSGGAKLITLPGEHGKLNVSAVERAINSVAGNGDHSSKPMLLSLTQATEFGTNYSIDEITTLAGIAHASGLRVHMDGARFANALVTQGCSAADMTWRAGVDLLSFGATKNGAMIAEALLVFDKADGQELGRRRKQAGHLVSKMRYISAQLDAYLQDDLWLSLAGHANSMATRLAEGIGSIPEISLLYPVQSNEVFINMKLELAEKLHDADFEFHDWPGRPDVFRLVMSHCTPVEQVDAFIAAANTLGNL